MGSKRYFTSHYLYDTIRNEEDSSTIFLSPYGHSLITLRNDYTHIYRTMALRIEVSKRWDTHPLSRLEFSFLYPLSIIAGILLFLNAKPFGLPSVLHP